MSDAADPNLEKIKAPDTPPPNVADRKTAKETKALRESKSPSPTDRMHESHCAHLETLNGHIQGLDREKSKLHSDATDLRQDLQTAQSRIERLVSTQSRLEEICVSVKWTGFLGNSLTLVGSLFLGVGGCAPGLTDVQKAVLAGGGGMGAACGLSVLVLSQCIGWRAKGLATPMPNSISSRADGR